MAPDKTSLTSLDSKTTSVRDSSFVDKSLPVDKSKKDFNYEQMSRPYGSSSDRRIEPFFGKNYNQNEGEAVIKTGESFTDMWINTWIKSKNYLPAKRGFNFDAPNGVVECQTLLAADITVRMVSTGTWPDTTGIEFNNGSFEGANVVKINGNGIILRPGKAVNFQEILGNFAGLFATKDIYPGQTYGDMHFFLTPSNRFFMYRYGSGNYQSVTEDTLFTVSDTAVFAGRPLLVNDTSNIANAGSITVVNGVGALVSTLTVNTILAYRSGALAGHITVENGDPLIPGHEHGSLSVYSISNNDLVNNYVDTNSANVGTAGSVAGHITIQDGAGVDYGDVIVNGKTFRAVMGAFDPTKYYLREI